MNFFTELKEGLSISWGAIRANTMRSSLTTLGIVIGIITVTLMGTAIEGEWEEVMGVVSRCFEALKKDCRRIYMTIKVDYRVGESGRMEGKMKTVERKS